jgi:hypothetical protein
VGLSNRRESREACAGSRAIRAQKQQAPGFMDRGQLARGRRPPFVFSVEWDLHKCHIHTKVTPTHPTVAKSPRLTERRCGKGARIPPTTHTHTHTHSRAKQLRPQSQGRQYGKPQQRQHNLAAIAHGLLPAPQRAALPPCHRHLHVHQPHSTHTRQRQMNTLAPSAVSEAEGEWGCAKAEEASVE